MGAQYLLNPRYLTSRTWQVHNLWGWQGSPRMALLLPWAQSSCPEASVAAALSWGSAHRASLAPGDLDVTLERSTGTKVPGNLTDTKYFLELDPPPFPRSSSSKHAKYSPEKSLLWPCQATSKSQPRLTAALPAWVFPPHHILQKGPLSTLCW